MQLDDAPQIAERRQITGRSIADVLEVFKKTASLKYAANSRAKYINALLKIQR